MVLSGRYSNTFKKIIEFKESIKDLPDIPVGSRECKNKRTYEDGRTEVTRKSQEQKILSKQGIEEAVKLYQEGKSSKAIAKRLNCHHRTVRNALRKAGITIDPHVEGRKFKTEDAIRLYVQEKLPIKEIAKKLGVCEGSIYKCLKNNSINTKRTRWDY